MAKQSGIHQLRGKVGEHSYYRQTGVSSGLVRQINQGMSARVKTEEAFANTRRNNVEFGGAGGVAGVLGGIVSPKFRPMVLPFSQSKMATAILELAKQNSGAWGERVVTSANTEQLADILTATSKSRLSDFCLVTQSRDSQSGELSVNVEFSNDQAATILGLGATGVVVKVTQFDVATGKYEPNLSRVHKSYSRERQSDSSSTVIETGFETELSVAVNPFNPTPELYNAHQFIVVMILPYRKVGSRDYTLQEHCMFACYKVAE